MQVLKEDVRATILQAARKCFMELGYAKTSMRSISKDAKMSTGNLYRYYSNKEKLFEEIVEPVVKLFEKSEIWIDNFQFPFLDTNLLLNQEIMDTIINAHVVYREELFLVFLRSEGSRYENVRNEFIYRVYQQGKVFLEKEFGDLNYVIDPEIYLKATATAFVESVFVILEESTDDYSFMRNMFQLMELNVKGTVRTLCAMRDNGEIFRRISDEEINDYIHYIGNH